MPTDEEFEGLLGARVKAIREQRGMSTYQLAALMEISQPQVTKLENGKRPWNLATMRRAAAGLGVHLHEILPDVRPPIVELHLDEGERALVTALRRGDYLTFLEQAALMVRDRRSRGGRSPE